MYALLLAALAVVLAGVAPRAMARLVSFRRAPRPALVAWQAVSLSAVLAALCAAPAAVAYLDTTAPGWFACSSEGGCATTIWWMENRRWVVLGIAAVVTVLVLGRLLLSGAMGERMAYASSITPRPLPTASRGDDREWS